MEASSERKAFTTRKYWIGGLFLVIVCASLVYRFFDSIWTTSIDISLHYALVARLAEHWRLVTNNDPSLEEMNTYPRYAHRLGAIAGNIVGSPLAGMEIVALGSLAVLWSGFALLFLALPRRALFILSAVLALLLLANRLFIHLELFGDELVGNYFYPQLVSQAILVVLIALALWLERTAISPAIGYIILGLSVPVLQQVHLLPAVELMAALALLIALNFLNVRYRNRRNLLLFGLLCVALSLFLTLYSPAFRIMVINAGNGVMKLNYTPTVGALAIECVMVVILSGLLVWQWLKLASAEDQIRRLTLKYIGLFGTAVAAMCLFQIIFLQLGYGSVYACQKFALGVNTALILDIALLAVSVLETRFPFSVGASYALPAGLLTQLFPGLFVLFAVLMILPSPSAKVIAVSEIIPAEHFAMKYGSIDPASNPHKYEYAAGLFNNDRVFDYLISIGDLKAPRGNDAFDLLFGYPLSKPKAVTRIFTRVGSEPWDVPVCRQLVTNDGFAILDGGCVLTKMGVLGEGQ